MDSNLRTDKLLDQIGWKLLHELQVNGRLSYAELGRPVGLTTPAVKLFSAILLPHEFTHSWNGKFRRPADMVVADFQQPEKTRLLWVYEGLTNYYGEVLAARCGLWTDEEARDALALTADQMAMSRGRAWRPWRLPRQSWRSRSSRARSNFGGPNSWPGTRLQVRQRSSSS